MPIFDNDINDQGVKLSNLQVPDVDLRSPDTKPIDPNLGKLPIYQGDTGNASSNSGGLPWGVMRSAPAQVGFDQPFSAVRGSELIENKRYPMYERNADLEDLYARQQPWYKQIANGFAKAGIGAVGTFAQSMMTIPDTVSAIKSGKLSELSGGVDGGVESKVSDWMKNMEDTFPNYISNYEKQHPFKSILGSGFSNFLGDKILKNIGIVGGFVAGAAVQDAAIGFVTEGLGEIPLLANQIGKASLALSKFLTGSNDVEKVLSALGESERIAGRVLTEGQIGNVIKSGQLAEATKLKDGLKYTLAQYGSARTMGAVDARDTYSEVSKKLVEQYKSTHGDNDPTGKDLDDIHEYATNAMNTRFGIDMVLLNISNAIQFDNLFKSFGKASKALASGATQDLEGLGKIGLKEGSLDEFVKQGAKTAPGKIWESVKPKLPNIFAESVLTMGGMFAGGKGVEDYYTNKYKDLNDPNNKETFNSVNQLIKSTQFALGQQFGTTEGLDAMFTGAMLGLVTGAIHNGIDRSKGMSKDQRLNEAINVLNKHKVTSVLEGRYSDTLNSVNNAKEMQEAVKENNIFKYKNLQHDNFFDFVNSRLQTGMHDYTIEQLRMLKDLPKEEFEKFFGVDFSESNKQTTSEYVDKLIDHANELKKSYDAISGTFKNPYERFVNPKTEAEKEATNNYHNFEEWKTNLTYYSSVKVDVNDRISSIQENLYKLHPDLNNNLVAGIVNPSVLKNIAEGYEERAKLLNGSIHDDMTAAERQSVKDQIKGLRTNSEKINLALNSKNLDAKTFHDILNFELNGQDGSREDAVGFEHAANLYEYGHDLNGLAIQKKKASLAVDALTSAEGFEKFFDLANKMNEDIRFNTKDFKETAPEEKPAAPAGGLGGAPEGPKFTNKEGAQEPIELNRQYESSSVGKSTIAKIDEDRWQITAPNGTVSFASTEAKAQLKANEFNQDAQDLSKLKVIAFNEDGTVKVEDVNGDIQNIPIDQLKGFERVETRQEKLLKHAEEVAKVQKELELSSGDIATGSDEEDIAKLLQSQTYEDSKKNASTGLFLGTTTESEDKTWSGVDKSAPHIVRARDFLNNASFLPNRKDLQAILVHYGNEEALGLSGLTKLSYGPLFPDDEKKLFDVNNGFLAQVWVTNDGHFINKDGEKIGKVGEPVDMNQIVFQTMPTTKLSRPNKFNVDEPLHRNNQKDEAILAQKQYINLRENLFKDNTVNVPYSNFTISKGHPIELEDGKQRNNVTETLLPPDEKMANKLISTQKGLIVISKNGKIQHGGESVKIPIGRPALQYGDTLVPLNNAKLNDKQIDTIFKILTKVSENMGNITKVTPELSFLQNILFYKTGTKDRKANQISIDEKTMNLYIGDNQFDISDVANLEKDIKDKLSNIYTSVNSDSLGKNFNNKFREFYTEGEELKSRTWDNYQTYLLSSKYPDGSNRAEVDIPLKTSVAKRTEEAPNNFQQRYSTISPTNLPFKTEVPVKKAEEKPVEKEVSAEDKQITDNANTFINNLIIKELNKDRELDKPKYDKQNTLYTIEFPNIGKVGFMLDAEGDINSEALLKDADFLATREKVVAKLKELAEAKKAPQQPAAPASENTAIELINKKLKSIKGDTLGFSPKVAPGTFKYTEDGTKVTLIKSQRDKYGRGEEVFNITYPDGDTTSVTVDYKQRPTNGWSDSKELPFDAKYSENPKSLFDELNALSNSKIKAPKTSDVKTEIDPNKFKGTGGDDDYKLVGVDPDKSQISAFDLAVLKQWHANNVPNIPYEVLENVINTHDNEKAFGVFQDGVAKFYRMATRGTEYHELFHGIFNGFLSESEREALKEEFKSNRGTFTERNTGKQIKYVDATDKQAEEKIADDFGEFRKGKMAAKSFGQKILDFFKSIINFIKSFVTKPSLKEKLFKDINTGKFKKAKLTTTDIEPLYSKVEGMSASQVHEAVQDMVIRASGLLFGESVEDIYSFKKLAGNEVFDKIEADYIKSGKRQLITDSAWNDLVKRTRDSLRTIVGLKFNDEEIADINNENVSNREYDRDPFSIGIKESSFGMKLLIGTLPATSNKSTLGRLPERKKSNNFDGFVLLPTSRTYPTMLNALANTSDVNLAIKKLGDLAKNDPNYVRVVDKLNGNTNDMTIDQNTFKPANWRLFIDFYQTFTKQRPEVFAQYTNGNEVYVGAANLYDASAKLQRGWLQNMRDLAKTEGALIKFNSKSENKTYDADPKAFANTSIDGTVNQLNFLNKLGVDITADTFTKLSNKDQKRIGDETNFIYEHLKNKKALASLKDGTLDVKGRFKTIADIIVKATNPLQDSTYNGVDGKMRQTNCQNNALSLFANRFNESASLQELKQNRPELNDPFCENSVILRPGGRFFDKEGVKIEGQELRVGLISGDLDELKDKGRSITRLSLGKRFSTEINQNLNGNFYAINPADSASEWQMNFGNEIPFTDIRGGIWDDIHFIFRGYLIDDVALALDYKKRQKLANVGKKAKELRFFKDILSEKNLEAIDDMIAKKTTKDEIVKYIDTNISKINEDVTKYLQDSANNLKKVLIDNTQISVNKSEEEVVETTYNFKSLENKFADVKEHRLDKFNLSEQDLNDLTLFNDVNKTIANIEYHKTLFGDPYQFAIKEKKGKIILEETKRIKSFDSPAETTFNSPEFNNFHNLEYNKTGLYGESNRIELAPRTDETPGDPGSDVFKDYMNTVTMNDMDIVGRVMGKTTENDASSIIRDNAYRQVKLRNRKWDDDAELFHQWNMSYTRNKLAAKGDYTYTSDDLKAYDAELIKTPEPPFVTEISKPIVRGNKYGSNTIDLILDKTSQMPLYYKMVEKSTLADLYIKMWKEDVDYVIAQSGRKLGSEEVHQLYVGGKFNNAPFNNNIKVPWSAYGIQVETDYDDKRGKLTAAVQVPKIVSMDLFEHGVPFTKDALRADVIQKEYQRGVNIKKALVDNGYNNLLDKLGLVDNGGNFDVVNRKKLAESLYYETLRTEVSDNIKDALTLDENGEFIIPFEATFAYKKIKDIIYSMLDKSIGHPKTNGGSYIQAPVTMWEDSSKGRRIAIKTDQGYKELSRAEYDKLPENRKGDVILTDDTLHFPTESDPYTGVRLPHWFGEKIKNNKRFDTDEKVLNYLNNTIEGQEILRAVGFRIPATEMASLEAIRVESFLPKQFGKTIIVPSEITTKQGSDFDVDKLNMYLKNVYIDKNNDLKLVRYQGSEKATKDFFGKVFDDILQNKKVKKAELLEASQILSYDLDDPKGLVDRYSQLLDVLLKDVSDPANFEESIMQQLEKLGDDDIQSKLKEEFIKDHYQASLENEYYDHLEKMITLPENFKALTTAVDDAGLSKLANELDDLRGRDESTIKNRVINGTYLTQTRHAFAMAKDWMGIVASNIAAHSIAQKGKVVIDPAFFENIDSADKKILGDGSIKIPHNTVDGFPTISGVKTVDGKQFISKRLAGHGTAIVDVAKDPYILKIIMSNLAPSSVMFLERIGTGETGLMLLAQPIVEKYLTYIDNIGASSLYSLGNINLIKSLFPTTEEALEAADTINVDKFDENIRKFYAKGEELSNIENAEQHLILDEVLKYAKMSDYLSDTNQALTYDTAKFSNGEALSKKQYRTKRALENNIFRGVEQLLDNTFLGNQAEVTDNGVNAIGEILKLESRPFTAITNQVLAPYMQNKYMKGDDFNAIGNRIKLSFLDFIVQTRANINEDILPLIADTETSIASQLARAKEEHPTIQILQDLESTNNAKVDGPKSVKLKANISGDAAAENIYIGMMRELRDNPSTTALYNNLVKVAILQGMYKSPISLGNIIPIEDFSKHITPIISTLNADGDLENFTKGWFQRNNFKDPTVFTKIEPKFNVAQWSRDEINRKPILYESNNPKKFQYFPSEELLNIVSTSRHILTLSDKFNYLATKSDYVQFPRVVEITRGKKPTGQFVDAQTGQAISKYEMSQYKAKGSDFHKDLYNYERVKDVDGKPFFIYRNGEKFHVYKLINVYGDGNVVSEYYNNFNPSRLNNGSIKVPIELTDEQIRSALAYKSAPAAPIELPVVKQQVVESIIDQGQQADIEPEYGLTKENFEYPEGYDEAMSNQPKRTILESRQTPINYTSGQIKALNQVGALIDKNEQAYYLLAGYAGTGKTTIAENIANYAKENGRNVVVIAPTNKAAKVLNDKLRKSGVGVNAATIHKTIYGELNPVTGEWIPNKTNLKNAVVLVDESSMIAKDVMKDLIANTKQNNIVVFMGDSFQLEPVGQGQDPKLFAGGVPEILNSQSQLTEVKRQGLDSNILKIATLARMDNKGYVPMESMPDFKVSKSRNEFINDFKESIKNDENSIMIVATNNERITMNDVARMTKFGPDRKILNDGETLIAVANSSDIPNSDIFKAVEVRGEPSKHELTFDFNGKISNYNMYFAYVVGEDGIERKVMHFPGLDRPSLYHSQILASIRIHDRALFESLDNGYDIINTKKGPKLSPAIVISTYGYSVTAHKSQGSQWDKVFVNQNYNSPSWNPARWYYTAITRSAKDLVVLPSASNIRIKNADVESKINAIAPEEKDVSSQANPLNINEANTEGSDNPNPCV